MASSQAFRTSISRVAFDAIHLALEIEVRNVYSSFVGTTGR
jgi:hypothetical protein